MALDEETEITESLYKDYSHFKQELYENLLQLNAIGPELLLRKTQKLLDRFLFLCFAEDKLLLPSNSVRMILEKWRKPHLMDDRVPLYHIFKKFFGYINTGFKQNGDEIFNYNGGLFKPDEILDNLLIDNDLLYQNMAKLADYNFASEVDVNILGRIFENSLNNTSRKKDGVFYTPRYITKYIVENTVGKLCQEQKEKLEIREEEFAISPPPTKKKKEKEIFEKEKSRLNAQIEAYREWLLQLTILDPACGSGAFLNEALQFLIEEHKYIDKLQAKLFRDGFYLGNIANEILENNIFGVDLNEESVEIAKLSLWLRTAQRGRQLSSLTDNIKCGNSLIDDAQIAGNKAFNWQENFPKVFEKGGFDVVIGNPPYGAYLSEKEKIFLERNY
jgi:type I restriction-modification system DNA methylase subunit